MSISHPWLIRLDEAHRHGQVMTQYDCEGRWVRCRVCGQALRRVQQVDE